MFVTYQILMNENILKKNKNNTNTNRSQKNNEMILFVGIYILLLQNNTLKLIYVNKLFKLNLIRGAWL